MIPDKVSRAELIFEGVRKNDLRLGSYFLGMKLAGCVFTPNERASMRIDSQVQHEFLKSIQAPVREGNHSRMKPENHSSDYRPAGMPQENGNLP